MLVFYLEVMTRKTQTAADDGCTCRRGGRQRHMAEDSDFFLRGKIQFGVLPQETHKLLKHRVETKLRALSAEEEM